MGLQVSHSMDTKMQTKKVVWGTSKIFGENIPRVSQSEGQQNTGGTYMPRSCAYPPKYAVSAVVGYIKGKSAIAIARTYMGKRQNFTGANFWARGYFVSTVGRDEAAIKKYIQEQEDEDKRLDQLDMFKDT